jgi:hypothetical protein
MRVNEVLNRISGRDIAESDITAQCPACGLDGQRLSDVEVRESDIETLYICAGCSEAMILVTHQGGTLYNLKPLGGLYVNVS